MAIINIRVIYARANGKYKYNDYYSIVSVKRQKSERVISVKKKINEKSNLIMPIIVHAYCMNENYIN